MKSKKSKKASKRPKKKCASKTKAIEKPPVSIRLQRQTSKFPKNYRCNPRIIIDIQKAHLLGDEEMKRIEDKENVTVEEKI